MCNDEKTNINTLREHSKMTSFFLKLAKNNQVGFCNQLYSTIGSCIYAYENNIRYIFISKYLKEIGTNGYCNVGDIYDLSRTNEFLSKYNVTLIDGFNVDLKIINILYGTDKYSLDITDNFFVVERKIVIYSDSKLGFFKGEPRKYFKDTFGVELQGPVKLQVNYTINNIFFSVDCEVVDGRLKKNFVIDYANADYEETKRFNNDDSPMFRELLRNFVFNETIVSKAEKYIDNSIIRYYIDVDKKKKKTINVFHLRLEDDAIKAWGQEVGMRDLAQYKKALEDKYINIIKQFVENGSLTIFLASDYDNGVIKYMRDNGYNYVTTPKLEQARDVSAIVDMHIGAVCTGICVGVWESSYSYTLFDRVKDKTGVKFIILYFTNLQHDGAFLDRGSP
jgi:hypothetical protein